MKPIELKIRSYFKAHIIGSYLLYMAGLLDKEDLGDIDILTTENETSKIREFLLDEGYKETKEPYEEKGYERKEGSLIFTKTGFLNIHLQQQRVEKEQPFYIYELIAEKFKLGRPKDFEHIIKACKRANQIKD
jgi:hypothetical protein